MRTALFRSILHQEIGWFDVNKYGELNARLSELVDTIMRHSLTRGQRMAQRAVNCYIHLHHHHHHHHHHRHHHHHHHHHHYMSLLASSFLQLQPHMTHTTKTYYNNKVCNIILILLLVSSFVDQYRELKKNKHMPINLV